MIAVQEQDEGRRAGPGPGRSVMRVLGTLWGIGGIAAVLVYAAAALGRYALEAVVDGLEPVEWLLLVVNTAFMAWAEGYRGFQQRFSPRVAARALNLYDHPTLPRLALAPLFCAGFFGATPGLLRTIWLGTGLIVLAVLLFNQLPQPWRGILDAGVLVGMIWGTTSLLAATWTTFRERREIVPADVPEALPCGVHETTRL
ncbi:MAG: hypothetical protein EXR82_06180 [Gammaproteobacteria bacterium]|nr:hypothetical protein [Gammaproteobacteria bacterium]